MITRNIKPQLPSLEEIERQLESMENSPDFRASPQQIALLKFVVKRTLEGNADSIKGYTVATEVFGRSADFDQSIDPIVSIQASRLRQALTDYYETAGKNDPIRIDIPKGRYLPAFNKQIPKDSKIPADQATSFGVMATWPSILVQPLANLTTHAEDNYLSIGLTAELAHALSHYRELRVLEALHRDEASRPRNADIDFIITGSVRRDPEGITVRIRLEDARKGIQIWSGKYQGDLEVAKMISFQEDVAQEVAVRMAGDNAVIHRHLAGHIGSKAKPDITTYEAMLRFWESESLLAPESMVRAIQALEHAVALNPEYGQTWSMLAAQYADNYGLEIIDLQTPLEKAVEFAQRGVSLAPTNRRARLILAYIRLMEGRLQEARHEAKAACNLSPHSLMVLDAIGWVMSLAGEWEQGVNLVQKAMGLNPYYRPWTHHVVFFNLLRKGDYEEAFRETFKFKVPQLFWDQINKAAVCGQLGKIEEGQASVRDLLALKPDFALRGRILISRFIKFEDIADRIIEGLGKLGLNIQ
ncbi:MAG: hypothetical protein QNJ58_25360 [Desulfobacterales bacterium]|nr:hypothetical protein [Desulfobacterales bacterium]